MRQLTSTMLVLLATGIAGCGDHSESISLARGSLSVSSAEVRIASSAGPDAHLTSDGRLLIGADDVALDAAARTAALAYFGAAQAITGHALETGKAGAEVGVAAAKEALNGIANGDTSHIGEHVEAKAADVARAALKICADIDALRTAQDALAADVARFRPYAVASVGDVSDCRKDLAPH
jgi:hypothetical protein